MTASSLPAPSSRPARPNVFDLAALLCIMGLAVVLGTAGRHMLAPISAPNAATIHLDPAWLPGYAVRTTLRMFAALGASLFFTFTYAVWAAKSPRAGLVLVPVLDVLQSVPILGFLTFTVVFFMGLFPGRILGAELAAIFTIFTSQAWNMAFSMYQSLRAVPPDLDEVARCFGLTGWQKFWRLEVPFAVPGLVWNAMISMSGGWFMVVYSETITVGNTNVLLPGIGSYVGTAIAQRDLWAVLYAIVAMMVVILAYDQLVFRPLVAWSGRFAATGIEGASASDPWLLVLLRRTALLRRITDAIGDGLTAIGGLKLGRRPSDARRTPLVPDRIRDVVWAVGLAMLSGGAAWQVWLYARATISMAEFLHVVSLGGLTLARVVAMVLLASLIWVPAGVWLGLDPVRARRAQFIAQFMAAFPANLFFPIFVLFIVHFHLSSDIWLTPLMILGTQWYILFNVVAGAASYPADLLEVARSLQVGGRLWWLRVILPGIVPFYITGAITASGGAWNAAIAAEVASWGDDHLSAHGLGAYIAHATVAGDTAHVGLGMTVMAAFVLLFNRAVWRPLAEYARRHFTLS
ncbi:binding-protein-dependent transport systems inner membrane component [Gluconacetobacter diazotrophicus PA1 5]|uniref:ABC transporter permease subunit n=2 Tax=Gluconacetobacter diazotrophicus TaxID=33996 RepID=A0A7W4FDV8_GLUDI|nr:ABC transporter permease subunit [Gluconacetobacter diazotrophicus]ACI53269.1 binding-protein-dependent transport systems inner membrane component [Gluconacetobacter diazotrophicus PA1 5]MBB2155877.1 ABC transporter permease subunit [Gluconacetobacter diazotrophicus]TWB10354.1 NitT/TauT family transport system permease protein [Gluconacetobacter diazotrophicus]CAP55709.1 putative glycine betaine transport system permease protein [Gluconacetobacter diazotrophicus PA1 5]